MNLENFQRMVIFRENGPCKPKSEKNRLLGSPSLLESLSLPWPAWPAEIKKFMIQNIGQSNNGKE